MSDNENESSPASHSGRDRQEAEVSEGGDLLVEDELLIEEISIDGMCGVY